MRWALLGVLFTCFVAFQAQAIIHGDQINWNRNSYLVKVFARNRGSDVKSCSGSLITDRLILTATSCILSDKTNEPMDEFAILLSIRNNRHHEKAQLLHTTENWALLEIHEISTAKLCPNDPEPKHVLRLNLKPTLKSSSIVNVSVNEITSSRCYLPGFNTTEQPTKFLQVTKVLRLDIGLKRPRENDAYYRSKVTGNFTACFDDVGAPLICETTAHGTMLVGLFQKIGIPIDADEDPQNRLKRRDHCKLAKEMYFSLLTEDNELINFIEEHKMSTLISTYEKCGFLREHQDYL